MSYVICKNMGRAVRLPEDRSAARGESLSCPASCKATCRASTGTFTVQMVRTGDPPAASFSYSAEELTASPAPAPSAATHTPTPAATPAPAATSAPAPAAPGRRFGSFRRTEAEPSPAKRETPVYLKPRRSYTGVVLGGRRFVNAQIALKHILTHFNTFFAFTDATTLNDQFVWLMSEYKPQIRTEDVDAILKNPEFTVPQKFFYLYYKVIFDPHYMPMYWYDIKSASGRGFSIDQLYPLFSTDDFAERYAHGDAEFMRFFETHSAEIVFYLGELGENADEIFEHITLTHAKEKRRILFFRRDGALGHRPADLGTVDEFVENMVKCRDFEKTGLMVEFLRRFFITARKDVVLRDGRHPLKEEAADGKMWNEEDSRVYSILGFSSASRYGQGLVLFCTLLREYMTVFEPDEVAISSELRFTKRNYSRELLKLVFEACSRRFSGLESDAQEGCCRVAKSLFFRGVIPYTVENRQTIEKAFSLLDDDSPAAYFKLYMELADRFGDRLLIGPSKAERVEEFIGRRLEERLPQESLSAICGFLSGDMIVSAYAEVFTDGYPAAEREVREMEDRLGTLYEHFKEAI